MLTAGTQDVPQLRKEMSLMASNQLGDECNRLIEQARKLAPEAEGFDPEGPYDLEALVNMRSRLSAMRQAIDLVNGGLARYWDEHFAGEKFEDEYAIWSTGHLKTKSIVDPDLFIEWVATLNAEELTKVFTPSRLVTVLKLTGLSPAERDTHVQEGYNPNSGRSINKKEKT